MTDGDLLLTQLKSLQSQCLALAHTIDAVLGVAEREALGSDVEAEESECLHPMTARVSIAAMGQPHRFLCRVCRQEVSVDERVQEES